MSRSPRLFSEVELMIDEEFLAALAKSLEHRVEPFEPAPIGHTDEGHPILPEADWLKMYERNHEGWEPAPEWLVQQLGGMPIPVDYVRRVVRGLIETAESAVADKGRRLVNDAAEAQRDKTDASLETIRQAVDATEPGKRIADPTVGALPDNSRLGRYRNAYRKRRQGKHNMSPEVAHADIEQLAWYRSWRKLPE